MRVLNLYHILETSRSGIKKTGLTFQEFADKSGLSREWVAKFAQGKINNPTVENLDKLVRFLERHNKKTAA